MSHKFPTQCTKGSYARKRNCKINSGMNFRLKNTRRLDLNLWFQNKANVSPSSFGGRYSPPQALQMKAQSFLVSMVKDPK